MVTWALSKAISLLAFFTTLIYVRAVGGLARRLIQKSTIVRREMIVIAICYIAPTTAIATAFLVMRGPIGAVWFSPTALWLSLILDFMIVLGAISYYITLWRLLRAPESFGLTVRLQEFEEWPGISVVEKFLRHIGILIGWMIIRRWFGEELFVAPNDFRRFLHEDFRLIDTISDDEMIEAKSVRSQSIPHLLGDEGIKSGGQYDLLMRIMRMIRPFLKVALSDFHRTSRKSSWGEENESVGQYHLINRVLNTTLPKELWTASRNLCLMTPEVISISWLRFHRQDGLRLRLVSLFITAELLQRLIGAMVISRLRDTERLPRMVSDSRPLKTPDGNGQWVRTLRWAMEKAGATDPALNQTRDFLLAPRSDFGELIRTLEPFGKIVTPAVLNSYARRDTLAGLDILWILRNKIIGHGGVGWQLQARPLIYLAALHKFFLALIRDLVRFDLKVFAMAPPQNHESKIIGGNRETEFVETADKDCLAAGNLPGSNECVLLDPYLRFSAGRLLIFNRLIKYNSECRAEYVDHLTEKVDEPTFLSFPADEASFLRRKDEVQ